MHTILLWRKTVQENSKRLRKYMTTADIFRSGYVIPLAERHHVKGQLEGNTQKDRKSEWRIDMGHYGSTRQTEPPDLGVKVQDVTTVLDNFDIKVWPFDQQGYDEGTELYP